MTALKAGDREAAAKMFGLNPSQADAAFKQLKEQADRVIKAHPGILDLAKGH